MAFSTGGIMIRQGDAETGAKIPSITILLLLIVLNLKVVLSANILTFFVVHPESHRIVKSTLFRELASRGHNVTVVSPFAEKDPPPNYEEIIVDEVLQISESFGRNYFKKDKKMSSKLALFLWDQGREVCDMVLRNPQIQQLIHSRDRHYDLIVLEAYIGDCFVPFSEKFNAPIIKLSTFSGTPWMTDWVGNPTEPSYVPDPFLDYTDKMTFWQRTMNAITTYLYKLTRKFYHMPNMDALVRKYFNESENLTPLWELEIERTSLLFLNTHFSIGYPRPLLPNIIHIGGLHLKPPKKLPQDIQSYLDEVEHGVIYFSMGSVMKSAYLPESTKKAFLEAFSKLKENVLWKWEEDSLPGKPSNVALRKWLPQTDVLAHPNVRAFITHGGQLSTQEAIYRGVPVIGIPVFGDQSLNMERAKAVGIGVRIDFHNVSAESVTWAVREVLDNPKYRENIQRLSKIFRDQPQTPLEQAVFWTEYVIRHKGAPHMRSAALDLTWYQYHLLDVIAVSAIVVIFILAIFLFLFRYIFIKAVCYLRKVSKVSVALLLVLNLNFATGANILAVFSFPSQSHKIIKNALFNELATRGHNITIICPFPEKNTMKNIVEIDIDKSLDVFRTYDDKFLFQNRLDMSPKIIFLIWDVSLATCENILREPEIQEFIHSRDNKFDLIILEAYFGDCFVPLGHKFDAPIIKFSTFGGTNWMPQWVGNPNEFSYVPDSYLPFSDKMTYFQRMLNAFIGMAFRISRRFYHLPKLENIIRKYFNGTLPPLLELDYTASLLMLNTHFIIGYPRPLLPNVVQVGGLHVKPPKELPQDIKEFLDKAEHGVIYFSMGSILKAVNIPEKMKRSFLEAFSKLKQNVLWKWETDSMDGQPSNVKLLNWLPQADILAHPNVKAFMTHCGLLSIQETINRGVPIVGIPVFGDQKLNAVRAETAGIGIQLDIHNVSKESVIWALSEILENPKYKQNAQKLSRIFQDQPLTPMEQAVFWIEYVIRHKGAPHMRSAALDLSWYQYFLLDVIAVLGIAFTAILLISFFFLRYLFEMFWKNRISRNCVQDKIK